MEYDPAQPNAPPQPLDTMTDAELKHLVSMASRELARRAMSSQVYENPIAEDAAEWYSHRQDALEAIGGYSNLRERERRQLDRLLGTETDADIVRIATRAFIMRKESERIRSRELAGR